MRILGLRLHNSMVTRLLLASMLFVAVGHYARYSFLTTSLQADLKQLVSAERLSLAQQVASSLDQRLRDRQELLVRVATAIDVDMLQHPAELRTWLQERQALLPAFGMGLVVVDRSGSPLAAWSPGDGRDVTARVQGAADALSAAWHGRIGMAGQVEGGQLLVPMAAPLRGKAGEIVGALIGVGSLSSLHPFDVVPQGTAPGDHGGLLLISPRDKLFLASTDPAMALKPTPPPGVNPLHDQAMQGLRGTGVTINAQGVEELSAMASVPSAGWFVVARIPTADAYAAVSRTKAFLRFGSLLTACLVFLFVGGLFWWALTPLVRAVRQAEAMTRGDMPLRPLPVVRRDEVGNLTAAFNRLLVKLVATQSELSLLAFHDSLTGLPNRRLLADRMRQALARSERHRTRVALMVLDLDGFKQINDLHGHDAGDEALRAVAERFQSALRRNDTLARLGGDEFVLLASDLAGTAEDAAAAARAIAAKCIAISSTPVPIEGGAEHVRLGVSIGIALCAAPCDAYRLMEAADQAMYEAKQSGRGRYVFSTWTADVAAALEPALEA